MSAETDLRIDARDFAIMHDHLVNICDEMAISMMRTAYSPIFSEGLDFSTLLLDREGDLAATTGINPAMLGASLYAATWVIQELGADRIRDGDVWIHNDPYRGGSHMPEHMIVTPVMVDGERVGYVGIIAHMSDIGGMAPGSFAASATEIYQEGLRLPPVKLVDEGRKVEDVWRIILANHRTARNTWGDLHAMLGALRLGVERFKRLAESQGKERTQETLRRLQNFSEAQLRDEVRRLPDGDYFASDHFDDDGQEARQFHIRLRMIVEGSDLVFDFSKSDDQALGPINAPYVVTLSASINGLLYLLGQDIPVNSGIARAVRVVAPPGTLCNVRHPGACVGGQTELQPRILELVSVAIGAQIRPSSSAGASGTTSLNFMFGGTSDDGDYFTHYQFESNGWGGRATADGSHAQVAPHAACRNTPIEVFETRWPWLHHRYGLRNGTAGAGKFRGGLGVERELEVDADSVTVSVLGDRAATPPRGVLGGQPGTGTRVELRRRGSGSSQPMHDEVGALSPTKFSNIRLRRGDTIRLLSPSGGGYGPAHERDADAVLMDVQCGFITADQAYESYGVVITGEDVDRTATMRRRQEM